MSEKPNLAASVTVMALYGAIIAGVAGLAVGVIAFLNGDGMSAGVAFAGAGITFGLVANALIRR